MQKLRLRYLAEDLLMMGLLLGVCALIVFGPQSQLSAPAATAATPMKIQHDQQLR